MGSRKEAGAESLYDFPRYLDLLFRDETQREADFILAACRKYATIRVNRMLEPGCGGGRLLLALARRGAEVIGFDQSQPALDYLRSRPASRRSSVETFVGDLADFQLRRRVDAAFCTFNTFRHLLTEEAAVNHLRCISKALRTGGVYILGFHLLPLDADEECIERWHARQGRLDVTCTLRVLSASRRQRIEHLRLSLLVRRPGRVWRLRTEFPLRMYTAAQFRRTLKQVPELELCDVFDFWYELDSPLQWDDQLADAVFVFRKQKDR